MAALRPTYLADCSNWDKGLIHQIEAWEWLQQHTDPKVLAEFAGKFSPDANESIGAAHESSPLPPAKLPIDWNDFDCKISKYFTVREVTNGDIRRIPAAGSEVAKNILSMAIELDKVRESWGKPIRVTSWHRPVAINRAVGGASRSQHIYGRGVDICPVDGDIYAFQDWLDERWYGALGWGAKRGFVHLDNRPPFGGFDTGGDKGPRWNY
jgi:putative chitinase